MGIPSDQREALGLGLGDQHPVEWVRMMSWEGTSNLHMAERGMRDFHTAYAHAHIPSGTQRRGFLEGLADAAHGLPNPEKLAWIADLEGSPNYPSLATKVAQGIAQEDLGAALSLIESLPPTERLNGYGSFLSTMAIQDPDATMAAIEAIGDSFQRDQALATMAYGLAVVDSQQAIEVIDQIEDPELRRGPVVMLLGWLGDENEAIRLGRKHGFDRESVLEARANSSRSSIMPVPIVCSPDGDARLGPRALAASSMMTLDDGVAGSRGDGGQNDPGR